MKGALRECVDATHWGIPASIATCVEIDNSGSVSDDWPTTYYKGAAVWYALVSSRGLAMRGIRIGKVTPRARRSTAEKSYPNHS